MWRRWQRGRAALEHTLAERCTERPCLFLAPSLFGPSHCCGGGDEEEGEWHRVSFRGAASNACLEIATTAC